MNPILDGLLSTASSMLSSTIVYPINASKIIFQTDPSLTPQSAVSKLLNRGRTEGFRSMYRGLTPTLMTYPIFWGAFFPIKNNVDLHVTGGHYVDKVCNVAFASSIASAVSNPLFVMQVRSVTGSVSSASGIAKAEGWRALWKGYPSTVLNNCKLCIQFPLYDYFNSSGYGILLSAFGAKTTANTITYPLELIRTTQRHSSKPLSIRDVIRDLGGIRGLYRGVYLYNAMSVPNFCLMMLFLETGRSWFG